MELVTVHPTNHRYCTTDGTTPLLLSGSNTQAVITDIGFAGFPPAANDWQAFIDECAGRGQTYIRLWVREFSRSAGGLQAQNYFAPLPYARTGPGDAMDGELKFDLTTFDTDYFTRLRERIQYADTKGIVCSVMLFNVVGIWPTPAAPWNIDGHPYASTNNINGITGETANLMKDCYRLGSQPTGVLARQEAYVEHVLDTVEDLPNVIIEIANEAESITATNDWQEYWIDKIHTYEAANSTYQHLVYRSPEGGLGVSDETVVLAAGAEIIAPDVDWTGYGTAGTIIPHAFALVSIYETDHISGAGSSTTTPLPIWPWKAFTRGHNFAYLDDYFGLYAGGPNDTEGTNPNLQTRAAAGHIVYYSRRVNLTTCVPNQSLTSTGYCLATPGTEYLVLDDSPSAFTVNLSTGGASGVAFRVEWLNIDTGAVIKGHEVIGGSASQSFTPPFASAPSGAVLLLTRASRPESVGNRYGRGWR